MQFDDFGGSSCRYWNQMDIVKLANPHGQTDRISKSRKIWARTIANAADLVSVSIS